MCILPQFLQPEKRADCFSGTDLMLPSCDRTTHTKGTRTMFPNKVMLLPKPLGMVIGNIEHMLINIPLPQIHLPASIHSRNGLHGQHVQIFSKSDHLAIFIKILILRIIFNSAYQNYSIPKVVFLLLSELFNWIVHALFLFSICHHFWQEFPDGKLLKCMVIFKHVSPIVHCTFQQTLTEMKPLIK